jgi:hypothetical protein
LLFETLAASTQLCTVGGEGHLLFEGQPELQPGADRVDSNRLLAEHCTDDIAARIHAAIESQLVDAAGQTVRSAAGLRFLEKTPKNALRLPFLERLFPDAQFLFLWRDPRENIASIIEAWKSGRWKNLQRTAWLRRTVVAAAAAGLAVDAGAPRRRNRRIPVGGDQPHPAR